MREIPGENGTGKSEKDKMLAGEPYVSTDPLLTAERAAAQALLRAYNASTDEPKEREAVLRRLFGRLGTNPGVMPPFFCDYGYNIRAGANLFVNYNCVFLDCAIIEIGDDVQIGPSVQIYTAQHPVEPELRRALVEYALPVKIGDNVWIGGGAILCPGVSVGTDSVIGAGSVVARDIPAGVVAMGNPCRPTRPVR